ncbi:MAG: hypothetical protein KJ018_18545 [Burkholderiales bacterium]|nr:hypothetical protein [Burkholderiales bacterium]
MSARSSTRRDESLYRHGSHIRVRPLHIGDRVRAYGEVGVVTAIDWSASTGHRIVTVAHSPRVRLRVAERDVELL